MLEAFGLAMVLGLGWITAHAVANLFLFCGYLVVGALGRLINPPAD